MTDPEIQEFVLGISRSRGLETMTANYRETRKLALLKEPVLDEGTLIFRAPAMFRKESSKPGGALHLSDGSTLWVVFSDKNTAEKYPLKSHRALQDSFMALSKAFNLTELNREFDVRGERSDGRVTLTLLPRRKGLKQSIRSVIVSFGSNNQIQTVEVGAMNGNTTTFQLSDERKLNVPGNIFQFSPQPGMTVSAPLGE